MTILRDVSFLWAMLHAVILFLPLFEPPLAAVHRRGWGVLSADHGHGSGTHSILHLFCLRLLTDSSDDIHG